MKKVLAAVLVLCVVLTAGAAFSQEMREHRNQQQFQRPDFNRQPQFFEGQDGRPGPRNDFHFGEQCRRRGIFTPDMPKEIREKAAELAKLRVDLEETLSSNPINKEKALETHAKMQKIKNELETWRFEKRIERMEEFKKQMKIEKTSEK